MHFRFPRRTVISGCVRWVILEARPRRTRGSDEHGTLLSWCKIPHSTHDRPARQKSFANDEAIRREYYRESEQLLKEVTSSSFLITVT
jgi:hypothetical protein